jgi:ubiquitin carboxyl-terminal hydrolase 25/28
MKKEHRTTAPISNDEQPNGQKYVIAAYCTNCRFHFDITADFSIRPDFQNPCRLSDEGSPMHHLRLVESMYAEDKHDLDKYNEFTESHRWACSGPTCPLVLEMKITPPRLKPKMLSQITGYNPLTPLMVLGNLRSYLADAKAARDKSELKRIAKRNKRFGLGFADDCDSIFNYLDFTQIKEEGSEIDVSVLFSGLLYAFCE